MVYSSHCCVLPLFIAVACRRCIYRRAHDRNHNTAHTQDMHARNKSKDWGEAQLHSSADWAVNCSFLGAGVYLWLNLHTVHHLFPKVDFSHHPAIQGIVIETCKEFGM